MTKTLTTEQQQFAEQNKMSPEFVKWFFEEKKDNCGNAWFLMAAAMWEGWKGLDSREAQPVGYIAEVSGNRVGVLRGLPMPDVGSLIYTAPPSLSVPDVGEIFEAAIDECRKSDVIDEHAWNHGVLVVMEKFKECRTAMLEAAPQASVNERIPPHIFSKLVGKLTDISREFSGTQQLRARIISGLEEHLVPDHPHTRGKVVVTKDEQGDIVAVTRQDSEGKVLEIIAERGNA